MLYIYCDTVESSFIDPLVLALILNLIDCICEIRLRIRERTVVERIGWRKVDCRAGTRGSCCLYQMRGFEAQTLTDGVGDTVAGVMDSGP